MSATERCTCGDEAFYHLANGKKQCVRVGCDCKAFHPAKQEAKK